MSKQEDKQIHAVVTSSAGTTTVDVPAGVIALEGADAPNVSPTASAFTAGKQLTTVNVTTAGVRFSNPA